MESLISKNVNNISREILEGNQEKIPHILIKKNDK